MKRLKKILSICLILLVTSNVYAAHGGAAFLKKGVGARALALGGAYTALADDTSSVYWNPAGLGRVQDYSITAMTASGSSSEWPDLEYMTPSYNFVALSAPMHKFTGKLGYSVFALGLINSTFENVLLSSEEGVALGTFENPSNAFFLSWGMPIWEDNTNLYAGVSLKYITEKMEGISGGSASGYDIDVGVIYNIFETLNFGLVINKGAEMKWDGGESDNAALKAKFGVSNQFNLTEKLKVIGALDIVQAQKEPLNSNLGVELSYFDIYENYYLGLSGVHVRGGVNSLALENRYGVRDDLNKNITYSIGFGIDLIVFGKFLQLDYALGLGNLFDRQNKISLNFYF